MRFSSLLFALALGAASSAHAAPMKLDDYLALRGPAPTTKLAYGPAPSQYAELFVPPGAGPFPVAVLVHGGCWNSKFGGITQFRNMAGALAAGRPAAPWRALGEWLGEAYQAADDIRDVAGDPRVMGKPIGRDVALLRPSTASELGLDGAIARFDQLVGCAIAAVPECRGAEQLRALVRLEAERLVPKTMSDDLVRVTV